MTVTALSRVLGLPGRVFSGLVLIAVLLLGSPASAQTPAVPDENTLARLVWGTMVALDNANRTGNYSVLHGLGTDEFQAQNSTRQLVGTFAPLRRNRVDVGRAILSTPTYYIPPAVTRDGDLRLRGGFDYRPKSIRFDLIYSLERGAWRITAMSVVEMDANAPKR
ncbi:MAG: hypothetical protein WBF53_08855 [Litorimonas sp.]